MLTEAEQNVLVEDNLGLAYKQAARAHQRWGDLLGDMEDYRQLAVLGLIEAARCNDPTRGHFGKFAVLVIRRALLEEAQREVRRRGPVRAGDVSLAAAPVDDDCNANTRAALALLELCTERERQCVERYFGLNGRPAMTPTEIARELGLALSRINNVLGAARRRMKSGRKAQNHRITRQPKAAPAA